MAGMGDHHGGMDNNHGLQQHGTSCQNQTCHNYAPHYHALSRSSRSLKPLSHLKQDGIPPQQDSPCQVAQVALHGGSQHKCATAAVCGKVVSESMHVHSTVQLIILQPKNRCELLGNVQKRSIPVTHLRLVQAAALRQCPPRTGQTVHGQGREGRAARAAAPARVDAGFNSMESVLAPHCTVYCL